MERPNSKDHILSILNYLRDKSDEEHLITTEEISTYLKGYSVIEKTLRDDISVLQDLGYDIILSNHQNNKYFIGERHFQTMEIKLSTDTIASSRVLSVRKSQKLDDKILLSSSDFQK